MNRLLRPWCWVTDHIWQVLRDYSWKRGRESGWIRDSRCVRCGLRPFPLGER